MGRYDPAEGLEKERFELIQAVQSQLDTLQSTTIVQPGERYTLEEHPGQIRTATTLLRATLHFALDTNTRVPVICKGISLGEGCTIGGQDCRLFCTPLWPKTPGAAWDIAALFHSTWQYSTLDGKPIASSTAAAARPQREEQFVVLHVTWQQRHWQVGFEDQALSSFDDPVCVATIGSVGNVSKK